VSLNNSFILTFKRPNSRLTQESSLTSFELVSVRECIIDFEAFLCSSSEATLILVEANVENLVFALCVVLHIIFFFLL